METNKLPLKLRKPEATAFPQAGAPAAPAKRLLPRLGKPAHAASPQAGAPAAPAQSPPPVPVPVRAAPDIGTLTLTVRIRPRLVLALRRATAARRETRIVPYTQPAIVEEALARWLTAAGFFDEG